MMVAEIAGIIVFFTVLAYFVPLLWVGASITSFVAFVCIINMDMNPEYKIPWISIVLLFPPIGALFFALFHERRMNRKETKHLAKLIESLKRLDRDKKCLVSLEKEDRNAYGKVLSLRNNDKYADVFENTNSEYFPLGEDMFKRMLTDMKKAKEFIFLEYFIVEIGFMWNSMLDILKEKAREGVEIRMLYDDIGCMETLPQDYAEYLREYNIRCYCFSKLTGDASPIHNNRDHRKIMVIDGRVGYTGGINLADEYINYIDRFGHWKDGGIRLEGKAVSSLTKLFLFNWDLNLKTISDYDKYLEYKGEEIESEGYYIPFGSGPAPLYRTSVGKDVFLNIINQAKEYVYITTPYLIIDSELTNALKNAATRNVDVSIITPHIPDKKLIQLLTRSVYQILMQAGVKIYEYTPGFIHNKNVLSDDIYGVVGTINFDYRSLVHHYENAVWMYKTTALSDMKRDFIETFAVSEEMNIKKAKMTLTQKALKAGISLFAPLL
jgi:cardiolipin synthase